MKKRIVAFFMVTMIMGISMHVSAANSDEKIIAKHHYTGSKSDFEMVVSQEVDTGLFARKNEENNIEFVENSMGVKAKIRVDRRNEKSKMNWKFSDDPNVKIKVEEDGSLIILDGKDELVGAVSSLEMKDSSGNLLEVSATSVGNVVHYEIEESTSIANGEIQLYGVNDFSQWFSAGSWITRDGQISLSLTHTGWAYAGIETGPISWSWNTVVNKFSGSANWRNAQGMLEQYQCHVNFASNKNPWNLEPWRPAVGYAGTIAASCNP